MDLELLETTGKVAGIGGIAIGALILVFRETLRKAILPKLTRQQAYRLLTLSMVLVWTVALAGIGVPKILGIRHLAGRGGSSRGVELHDGGRATRRQEARLTAPGRRQNRDTARDVGSTAHET